MARISVREAQETLPQLVERAEAGEEIVICRNGTPVATLVPIPATNSLAKIHGVLRGRIEFAPDFDALPDDIARSFGARRSHR